MIKIGDKVIWQSEEWEVYSIEEHIVEIRRVENGFGIGTNVDLKFLESNYYKQLYEQQKQRADQLELLIENFLYANQYSDIYAIQSEEEFREKYKKLKSR